MDIRPHTAAAVRPVASPCQPAVRTPAVWRAPLWTDLRIYGEVSPMNPYVYDKFVCYISHVYFDCTFIKLRKKIVKQHYHKFEN